MLGPFRDLSPSGLQKFDNVRVIAIFNKQSVLEAANVARRRPRVGDEAVILEEHTDPIAFDLECCDAEGSLVWSGTFRYEDLLIDRVD